LCKHWRTKQHRSNDTDNDDTHGIPLEGAVTGDELTREAWDEIAKRTARAAATSGSGIRLAFHSLRYSYCTD
jgi:hypothetical protein